jgi:phenylalanyl-tRNA synthetase beta chain
VTYIKRKIEDFCFLNFANTTKIIGQEIPKDTIKQILVLVRYKKVNSISEYGLGFNHSILCVDVKREIDVIEEI